MKHELKYQSTVIISQTKKTAMLNGVVVCVLWGAINHVSILIIAIEDFFVV